MAMIFVVHDKNIKDDGDADDDKDDIDEDEADDNDNEAVSKDDDDDNSDDDDNYYDDNDDDYDDNLLTTMAMTMMITYDVEIVDDALFYQNNN